MDYGNNKTPSTHPRPGSVTVRAGFSWGKQTKFPMGEIPMGQYNCKINKKPNKTNKPTTLRPSDFANSHLAGWTNSYSKCQREPRTDSILQGLSRHRIFRQIQPFTQQRCISVQLSPWQVCAGGRATWRLRSKPSSSSEVARTGREMGQRLLTPAQKQEGKHDGKWL